MKKFKKISALILTIALLATSLMTGGIVYAEDILPETNTTLNAVGNWNNWSNAINTNAFEHSGIEYIDAANGIVSKYYPDAYVVYRVEKNSPFIANFKIFTDGTDGRPVFYVSPDGVNYTEYEMNSNITKSESDPDYGKVNHVTYYTNGIGENNKYVKIIICDKKAAYPFCDLRSLSYNKNTEAQITPDTKLNFVNNFDNLVSPYQNTHLVEVTSDRTHVSGGGLSGTDTPNTYIVFKVQDNSPIKAEVKCTASARPAFYTSPDGINWTKLALKATRSTQNNQIIIYYRDGIGVGNRYLKVQTSTTKLANVWESDLQTISFNANTAPTFDNLDYDTTFDVATQYNLFKDTAYSTGERLAENKDNTGKVTGMGGGAGVNSYIVYKVRKNSAFYTKFKVVNENSVKYNPVFYTSENGTDWTQLGMHVKQIGQTFEYYRDCIGVNNKYIKIVLSTIDGAWWHSDLQVFKTNLFPLTDTTFNYAATDINTVKEYAFYTNGRMDQNKDSSGTPTGLGGGEGENSYVVYKVQKNSAFYANFKIVNENNIDYSPVFYASSDGLKWSVLTMKVFNKSSQERTYYIDGIGAENKYIKIVLSTVAGAWWHSDLRILGFNANTDEKATFDTTLNFKGDYNSVFFPALSKATAHSEVQQNANDSGPLGMIGTKGVNSYVVYEVEKNSAISATFNLANGYGPSFYVSNDGTEWTKVGMEKEGSTYYRDCIGAENKYVKIVLSEKEGAHWQSELRTFSYNLVDPSGNGKIDLDDLVLARKQLLGVENSYKIDFNRDGKEDILDLVRIKKHLAEKIN